MPLTQDELRMLKTVNDYDGNPMPRDDAEKLLHNLAAFMEKLQAKAGAIRSAAVPADKPPT